MPISRRQSWRPWATKDPASETTAIANEHVRLIVSRVASDAYLRRNLNVVQANNLVQRRRWRKSSDGELTPTDNRLIVRVVGAQQASSIALTRRQQATVQANGVRWQRKPLKPVPAVRNERIQVQTGLLATQRARRAVIASVQPSLRLWRVLAWLAPSDTQIFVGDIDLTEPIRRGTFTEITRGALDEFVRSRAVVEMNRGALTELSRSRAFTEPDL